jgi:hypothetical protein
MSMTTPYFHETADALDTTWTTAEEAAAALCLIDTALEVEDDPFWVDELVERREAATTFVAALDSSATPLPD